MMLEREGIRVHIIEDSMDYQRFAAHLTERISEPMIKILVVELTKKVIEAIKKWIEEKRKNGKRSSLRITIEGDVLKLNSGDAKVLQEILKQSEKNKRTRKKRRKKNEDTSQNEGKR